MHASYLIKAQNTAVCILSVCHGVVVKLTSLYRQITKTSNLLVSYLAVVCADQLCCLDSSSGEAPCNARSAHTVSSILRDKIVLGFCFGVFFGFD